KKEVFKYFPKADIIISAAAIVDFRPKNIIFGKIKKNGSQKLNLELEKTSDILAELGRKKSGKILVGFAAEAENLTENAFKKLTEKQLDLIIANNIMEKNVGFASDKNSAKIISQKGVIKELPIMQKSEMAVKILDEILKIV
ncbi:MAG: phosphopantothenoylcysteine decarboxylase, partial [Candidatus Caldatribacteriota bacterium]|nr:phosphopantothenoylcysteine decarboxylase [Candidatus Caldatribacteriota bacterium]